MLHQFALRLATLSLADLEPAPTTGGEMNMRAARHTAGQRVLERTGDLKLGQRLFDHASIRTTGDIYGGYDLDRLAAKLGDLYSDGGEE